MHLVELLAYARTVGQELGGVAVPIHILDLIGVFAFAIFGSHKALEKKFNIYGIIACAALTALGGGTIREVILHHLPVYFADHAYLYAALSAALLTIMVHKHFAEIRSYALLMDALGLAVFSFIGAQKAGNAGLGCVGMIFFASITAAGGGILTDIVTGDKPTPFTCEAYILPAASGGFLYWLLEANANHPTIYRTGFILLVPLAMRIGWLAGKGELQLSGSAAAASSSPRGPAVAGGSCRGSIAGWRAYARSGRPGRRQ